MSTRTKTGDVLGIALTPGSITAAAASVPTVWTAELELKGGANGSLELLGEALSEAARASGLQAPGLFVALLPPLAETRTISLPPLRDDERNRFLARNASRYFLAAKGAQIVGSSAPPQRAKGSSPAAVVASSTAHQLMQAVHSASAAAGCSVRAVVPAEAAWAAATVAIWPSLAKGHAHVVVATDGRCDLLTLADGALESVRRFRGAADADQIAPVVNDGGHGTGRAAVIGPPDAARAITEALAGAGVRTLAPEPKWRELSERPEALAARFAADAGGLEFRSEESREQQRATVRRTSWQALGVAAAVFIVAAAVHYAGIKRELAAVQAERAAMRAQVDASLAGRSSVDVSYRQVAALATIVRSAPRWSGVLANLAAHLPLDASLSAFRARGDSIFIDGVAEQAAPVFDELGRMPGVIGVRATAPVRRDAIEGEAPLEHFSIGAQLVGVKR